MIYSETRKKNSSAYRLSDVERRHVIQAATNKSEAFYKFVQWVCFGDEGILTESVRDERDGGVKKFV